MKHTIATLAMGLVSVAGFSQMTTIVGGEVMYPTKDIIDNAVNSADHTTLVAAVKAAGLVETLKGNGPFTVFAPTNDAFENLPAGTVETLLKPENKAKLTSVLTYHVVAGNWTADDITKEIKKSKTGTFEVTTVSGGKLWFTLNGNNIIIKDENGHWANIIVSDVVQSNGVIHTIDKVVLPKG